ncbi:MAG: response regulator transcription factor [Candidatus Wildermuthbacteria bacterium]|nr:response regulator transcription factor [Candidatus Wildermuthbacteria bacterium]
MSVRILVVDDHALVREGIVKLVSSFRDFEVVGEADDGFEAIRKTATLKPDIVLMDLYLPGLGGDDATRIIIRDNPDVRVIILSASIAEDDIMRAVQAGARGYVSKGVNSVDLCKQMKNVSMGGVALTGEMIARLVGALMLSKSPPQNGTPALPLSRREEEVLGLVVQGMTNKQIASALLVSENTIRAHIRSLMQKLNLDNRTQLAIYGLRHEFVKEDVAANAN